jgi:hypothetical protein
MFARSEAHRALRQRELDLDLGAFLQSLADKVVADAEGTDQAAVHPCLLLPRR